MANIKSNMKSDRKNKKRKIANKAAITNLRTNIKKVKASKDAKSLNAVYQSAASLASKGKIHKNKAARIQSAAAKLVNKK